ncbi:solute carrier family 2 member 9, like 1 [Chaetodon trifascialis]|uniref:solute carrier family 2 member 9, like 1 n=1 Tax=Chaetodon trifascialis TaxID=109706 RepID=UPI00399447DC
MQCKVHVSQDRMETLLRQLTRGKVVLLIIILGFGGSFQFGFHLTELSSPSLYIQRFINSSWYNRYEELPPPQTITMIWSLIVSFYAVGGLCGTISVRFVSALLGRKKMMICNSFVVIAAAGIVLTSKSAKSYEMIIVSRFLYGCSTGVALSTHLIYLAEISPRKLRGIVTLSYATFLSLGKLSGQFFGLSEILGCEELWNIVLCVPAFFAVLQIIVLPFLPEAPRYLFIEKGDAKACKKALQSLWGQGDYKDEMEEMLAEQAAFEAAPPTGALQLLRDKTIRWQLVTMWIVYISNQLSGMSVVSTFTFDILLEAGIAEDKIRYVTLGLGMTEIVTYISSGLLIDRIGRRPLFWGCYGLMSVCWVLFTVTLNLKNSSDWAPYMTTFLIILFTILFCGGPGGAGPTLNSEVFIQSNLLAASVLVGFLRWLTFAIMGLTFPFLINALDSYSFVLFACVCLLGCIYTFFILPETKGKTLLEISKEFKAITICGKSFSEEEGMETKF